jgi:retron-type reverse transcriptase
LEVRQLHSSEEAREQSGEKINVAEYVERRELTKRKSFNRSKTMTQSVEVLLSRLDRLGEAAKRDKSLQFNNLFHHITLASLHKAFNHLNKRAAKGVDNIGWFEYQQTAKASLTALHQKLQLGCYKAKPVKRIWIPKADGTLRPIGVTSIEDKIVQQTIVWLLEPIYESDFLGFSCKR